MFKDVLKSIIPIPKNTVMPVSTYRVRQQANAASTHSRRYWEEVAKTPTSDGWREYEFVQCEEHGEQEAVPHASYYDGLLHYWYKAGLHPRWDIWGAIVAADPRFPGSWLNRVNIVELLIKYKNSPKKFGAAVVKAWKDSRNVSLTAGGRTWRVPRGFRDDYKAKRFLVANFLAETNQTMRRLMIMSHSFTIEEVVKYMVLVAKDEEGEILLDRTNTWSMGQQYLHVVCPTTGEHYLLGIPFRQACQHGYPIDRTNSPITWRLTAKDGCWEADPTKTAWTPAAARRWTFGLEPDAEFVAEA